MMLKRFLQWVSTLLVIVFVFQMLPLQVLAAQNTQSPAAGVNEEQLPASAEATVVAELTEERDTYTKQFLLDNGNIMAVQYAMPVHYQDADGTWRQYDNRMEEVPVPADADTTLSAEYRVIESDKEIRLSHKASEKKLVTIEKDGHQISWGFSGVNKSTVQFTEADHSYEGNDAHLTLQGIIQEAIYADAFTDVDLQYYILPTGVKENILLKNKNTQNEFEIEYKYHGLTATQIDSRHIALTDPEGNTVYTITAPAMVDANGVWSNALELTVVEAKNNKLTVKLTADAQWLQDDARAYPVTVDPSFNTDRTWGSVDSTTIVSGHPDRSYGLGSNNYIGCMYVGYEPNSSFRKSRALVRLNTLPQLSPGDVIVDAQFCLLQDASYRAIQVNVHQATAQWAMATATWNNMNTAYNPSVEDYDITTYGADDVYSAWNVTNLVRQWYDGTAENHGFMVIAPTETATSMSRVIYYASTYPDSISVRPVLQITYRNNKGIESYWTYHSQSLSVGAVGAINDYSGNLVYQVPVMSESGARLPISVNLTYNGYTSDKQFMGGTSGPVTGNGWQMNFNQRCLSVDRITELGTSVITALKNAGYLHVYIDADGTVHYFKKTTSNYILEDEDGLGMTMKVNQVTGSPYYIECTDGSQLHFNADGYIYKMVDADGNDATVTYDGANITSIQDGAGRVTTFTYSAYNNMSRLTGVTDPSGRTTTLTYDGGNLQRVTYPDGTSVQFRYTTVTANGKEYNLITRVTDLDGTYLSYTYKTAGLAQEYARVASVQEHAADGTPGNSMTITYNQDNTTDYSYTVGSVTTEESYCFDHFGRTVCILNADGSSVYGSYVAATGKKNNRLSFQAQGAPHIENLLADSSAENAESGWTVETYNLPCVSIDTTEHYLGAKSMKVETTAGSESPVVVAEQVVDVAPGQTYTFSAYVKTDNVRIAPGNYGAMLNVFFLSDRDSSNHVSAHTSEYLVGTQDWQRIKVTATAPENATAVRVCCGLWGATGTAWFDCMQLEVGRTMNDYNMLTNSSFSGTSGWTGQNLATGDGIDSANDRYVISGEYGKMRSAEQTVQIGRKGTGFTLSAKAQGHSVPVGYENRSFGLALDVYYEDGSVSNHNAQFNPDTSGTQYLSTTVLVPEEKRDLTVSYVKYRITYDYNANSVWFDECMLTFDETGTAYTYDSDGNVISAADNAGRNATYTYNDAQELIGTTNGNNESYSYTYSDTNEHRLVAARSNQLGSGFTYTYDSFGNIVGTKMGTVDTSGVLDTDELYLESGVTYDSTGNYVTAVTDQRGNTVSYNIDPISGLTGSITDPSGATTSYTYEEDSWLPLTVTSGDASVSYGYDAYNRLTQIRHNGFTYHFTFDKFGNTGTVKVGNQALITNAYENGNGQLQSATYGNGTVYSYAYDTYGRVTDVFINGVKSYSTVYNAKGQVAEIIDLVNDVTTCYTYDISGRPLRSTQSDGKSISTGYDILNRVTSVNYQFAGESYTASYGYGADGQKGTSTLISGDTHTATYDSLGRETASIVGGRLTRGITYWNVGGNKTTTLPQTLSYTQGGSTLLSTAYTYDSRGNIATMTVDGVTWSYTYDSLNQLTGVTTSDNSFTASYSYDNGGNITSKTVNGVTTTYGYNDPNWKDKLTRYGNEGVSSDRIGNIWQIGTYQMSYVGRQLIEVYTAENNTINFYYNADGIRVKKVNEDIGTTNYFVDGSTILAEQTGTDVIWYIYDSNGEIVGFTYNEVPYYYLKNQQGDVYKIVEENGTLAGSYTYDPWGKVLTCTGTIAEINPIRYRSYYYDTETGYYYLQSRYYDPELGRFISADSYVSTGQGILGNNMYTYCLNNPVLWTDYSGTMATGSCETYYSDGSVYGSLGIYSELRNAARGLGYEVHHLLERRFHSQISGWTEMLPSTNKMPGVVISKEEHRQITNAWRKVYPYGQRVDIPLSEIKAFYRYEYTRIGKGEWADLLDMFLE